MGIRGTVLVAFLGANDSQGLARLESHPVFAIREPPCACLACSVRPYSPGSGLVNGDRGMAACLLDTALHSAAADALNSLKGAQS